MMPPEGRGFESHRLRHKKNTVVLLELRCFLLNVNSRGKSEKFEYMIFTSG